MKHIKFNNYLSLKKDFKNKNIERLKFKQSKFNNKLDNKSKLKLLSQGMKASVFIKNFNNVNNKKENKKKIYLQYLNSEKRVGILKYIKYIQHIYKEKKSVIKNKCNKLHRFFFIYKLYKKSKGNYYFVSDQLKKVKKKKKNFKYYLWKTLTLNNSNEVLVNNIFNIDIDKSFNLFNSLNYYNINNSKKKKSVFYKFFNNNAFFVILKNRFNLINADLSINVKDNYLTLFQYLRQCNLEYYNKYFKIYIKDYNYYYSFYNILKNNILLKIFNIFNNINSIHLKEHIINNKQDYYIYNYFYNSNNNNTDVLKKFKNETSVWTLFLIKMKKWNKNSMYFWSLDYFKKMIVQFIKLNIRFNCKSRIKKIKTNLYYNFKQKHILDTKLEINKYWILFSNFIYKSVLFNKLIFKKNILNSKYILKKYVFFINFMKSYLFKIFNCLKYIYFFNNNKIQYFMLKLRFIIFLIFYKKNVKTLLVKKFKKRNLQIFKSKSVTKFAQNYRAQFFNNIVAKYKRKVKNCWLIKKKERYVTVSLKDKYKQPFSIFAYNSALNPKHNSTVMWRKKKHKKVNKFLLNAIKHIAYKYKIKLKKKFFKNKKLLAKSLKQNKKYKNYGKKTVI